MPLRVPELASPLGRLIVPRRLSPPWIPVDDAREDLATRILELGGEGRRASEREDREGVLSATSSAAWLAAWEQSVRRVAERVARALDEAIELAARRVRMPRRRWRKRLLAAAEQRAIAARLAAGGDGFVAALLELDAAAATVRQASVLDREAHAARRLAAADLRAEALGHDRVVALRGAGRDQGLSGADDAVAARARHAYDEVASHRCS